jgi:general nucleoside transport system permease protein
VRRAAARRRWHWVVVGLLMYGGVRLFSGTGDLTSSGTTSSALRLAVPILLAGVGGLWSERAGVINIGLEGMMVLGTWFGAWGAFHHGPAWGVALGMLGGAAGAAVHAVAVIVFGVDQIISGVAVNLLAAGVVRELSSLAWEGRSGGGLTQSPPVPRGTGHLTVPFLSGGRLFGWASPDVLGAAERRHLFPLSDAAGLARGLTAGVSTLTIVAVALVPVTAYVLRRTRFGLRLRAVGEHAEAARSSGVAVARTQAVAVVISGLLAGLGGAYLVLEGAGLYREGQVGGRGFIGLAAVVFGNWRPVGVATGAGLFGYADAISLREARTVRSLLLVAATVLLVVAVRAGAGRHRLRGLAFAVAAAGFVVWFARVETVPPQIVFFTPHLVTLVVLAGAAGPSSRAPATWAPI